MKVLDRFLAWRARRRYLAHRRWLRRHRVVITSKIEPQCIVRNMREPNR